MHILEIMLTTLPDGVEIPVWAAVSVLFLKVLTSYTPFFKSVFGGSRCKEELEKEKNKNCKLEEENNNLRKNLDEVKTKLNAVMNRIDVLQRIDPENTSLNAVIPDDE